jgi:hypothetical protein
MLKLVFVLNVPDRFDPPPRYHLGPPMPTEEETVEELRQMKLAGWYVEDERSQESAWEGHRGIAGD